MAPHYAAYGLTLRAQRKVPGLSPISTTAAIDVEIGWRGAGCAGADPRRLAFGGQRDMAVPGASVLRSSDGDWYRIVYEEGVAFTLDRRGSAVWVDAPATVADETVLTYFFGPIFGIVLRLRRVLCLHASAVEVGGQALVFVGPAGAGKSSLAAALLAAGYPLLADDKVTLLAVADGFLAQPGIARIRLWPESAEAIFGSASSLPRLLPDRPAFDKRYVDLSDRSGAFCGAPLPLGGLYLLGARTTDRSAPLVQPLHRHPGVVGLVANTYMNQLADRSVRAWEFDLLARVASTAPLRLVTAAANLDELPRLCRAILADAAQFGLTLRRPM